MKELKSISKLTDAFEKFPSVGHRSASKMTYAVLNMEKSDVDELINALKEVKEKVHKCVRCNIYTEDEMCEICLDKNRNTNQLMVVTSSKEVEVFEKLKSYNGLYHVLGGNLSASNFIGADSLSIDSLIKRIEKEGIKEVILATNSTLDGETTALYIAKLLENVDVDVTRLGFGLPVGGYLEYADSLTLEKALEGRKKI